MPTTYVDQAYPVDAFNLAVPQNLTVGSITLVDQNDDGIIDTSDTLNGAAISAVYSGDTITVNGVQMTGATIYSSTGLRQFVALDGTVLSDGTATASTWVTAPSNFEVSNLFPLCFVAGTRIDTPSGPVLVERLKPGDYVFTADNGPQRVAWVGCGDVAGQGKFAPVRICESVLGAARDVFAS